MQYMKNIPKCPVCGSTAFIAHDVIDGYSFGWSVGCPRFCINDGIHGCNDFESAEAARLTLRGFATKQEAIDAWKKRCEEGE